MKQSKGDEEVQMFFADILQRVGLYAYRGNLVDMLTAIREDQSALEACRGWRYSAAGRLPGNGENAG